MKRIVTPRLVLRPVGSQDCDGVLAGLNDLAVSGWLSVVPFLYTEQDFAVFRDEVCHPGSTWTILEAGRLAGILGLERETLGYWLMPAAQGRGLATEAAGAVLAAHFAGGGGEVASGYFEGNQRSARVLGKLGFAETGRDAKLCRALGQDRPHVTLGLTAEAFALSAFNLA